MSEFTGLEFAIWGIPPGKSDSTLLVAMPNGKPITERGEAERIKALLESEHGCTACRVQVLDGSLPDFAATVNQ